MNETKNDKNEQEDKALTYRNYLISSKRESQHNLDTFIISLSSGSLSISVIFIAHVLKGKTIECKVLLILSWITLGFAIAAVLFSFLSSINAASKAINDFDEDQLKEDEPTGCWNYITDSLNIISILFLSAGIFLLLLFVSINL